MAHHFLARLSHVVPRPSAISLGDEGPSGLTISRVGEIDAFLRGREPPSRDRSADPSAAVDARKVRLLDAAPTPDRPMVVRARRGQAVTERGSSIPSSAA